MGTIHSLFDSPSGGGYSIMHKHLLQPRFCRTCGSALSDPTMLPSNPDQNSLSNQPVSWVGGHHAAELCGVWLGKFPPANNQNSQHSIEKRASSTSPLRLAETDQDFDVSPSTTLPKRLVTPNKSHIVATLLRHTTATGSMSTFKYQHSNNCKYGFSPLNDLNHHSSNLLLAEPQGCRIHGCLFMEHGNLVFQATNPKCHIPSILTNPSKATANQPINEEDSNFNSNPNFDKFEPMDPKPHHESGQKSSSTLALYRNAKQKLGTCHQQRDGYKPLTKSRRKTDLIGGEKSNTIQSRCQSKQAKSDPSSKQRLPPPPLRLSWPLVTLRRFGFYGSTLFKVEAGRRAPRGEGQYLFRIKRLREFRNFFENYVHRRKSLSPNSAMPDPTSLHNMKTLTLPVDYQNQTELIPEHEDDTSDIAKPNRRNHSHTQLPHRHLSYHPHFRSPPDGANKLSTSNFCDPLGPANLLIPTDVEDHSVPLPDPTHQSTGRRFRHPQRVSSACLHWLQLQHNHLTDPGCMINFKNSCPQLATTSSARLYPHSFRCEGRDKDDDDDEADEISNLPDPPPPPSLQQLDSSPSTVNRLQPSPPLPELHDCHSSLKHYDNISPDRLQKLCHISCANFSDLDLRPSVRGRFYNSRRATTALGCCEDSRPAPMELREEDEEDFGVDSNRNYPESADSNGLNSNPVSNLVSSTTNKDLTPINDLAEHPSPATVAVTTSPGHNSISSSSHIVGSLVHLRHASLPTPNLWTYGECPQDGDSNNPNSRTGDFLDVINHQHNQSDTSPYYNLSSPEAILQFRRSESSNFQPLCSPSRLSHTNSVTCKMPSPDLNPTTSAHSKKPLSVGSFPQFVQDNNLAHHHLHHHHHHHHHHHSHESEDFARIFTFNPDQIDNLDMIVHDKTVSLPCSSAWSTSALHYATLDFSASTGPAPPAMASGTAEPLPGSPTSPDSYPIRLDSDADSTLAPSLPNQCPNHPACLSMTSVHFCRNRSRSVYGTMTDTLLNPGPDSTMNCPSANNNSNPMSSDSNSMLLDPSTRPAGNQMVNEPDPDLPTNYVAICQLQTLAMRAVLSATT